MPSPLSTKVTPAGKAPVSDRPGTGVPVVVTVRLDDVPTVNVALSADMIVGGVATTSVATSCTDGSGVVS